VHFPTLIKLAQDIGMNMLEITNLCEFYEDNRKHYAEHLKTTVLINKQGKIEPAQKDLIGLYTTFVFQKTENS